ncbi:hypothetical protein AMJ80_02040 [bacterium SM23_31]|nr:MAG: hypothetical protein AMJ80_02040 [bacterium SM23_31]
MSSVTMFFASRKGIALSGLFIGAAAALLQKAGNPANMGICVACFERDIAGKLGFHREEVVQYIRPESIAELFNVKNPLRIVFGLNATEALNLALNGLLRPGDHVITSSMEHNSVMCPLRKLENNGIEITVIQCSPYGFLDPGDVEKSIKKNTVMIVLNHASNVTGSLLPVSAGGSQNHRDFSCRHR